MPTGKIVRAPVASGVGGQLKIPALPRHADDDQAEAGSVVEQLVHQAQLRRVAAHEHGSEAARRRRPRGSSTVRVKSW